MSPQPGSESESANLQADRALQRIETVAGHELRPRRLTQRAVGLARALGFWGAIVLPFLHIPLLMTGLSSRAEVIAFALLVGANVVAIRLGMEYRRNP